jgi:hypothetical protein
VLRDGPQRRHSWRLEHRLFPCDWHQSGRACLWVGWQPLVVATKGPMDPDDRVAVRVNSANDVGAERPAARDPR